MVLVLQSDGIPIEMIIMMNDNNNDDDKDASALCYVNHYADEKQLLFHHAAKIMQYTGNTDSDSDGDNG